MAKILPPEASPPSVKIERRHNPKAATGDGGYRKYRPCLRWDFGFTCPFCLQHEADIEPRGAEGTGLTTAEHRELQKDNSDSKNLYSNCLYCCRFCNRDRYIDELVDRKGRRLLDPTEVPWAEHFELIDDEVHARASDDDADYTVESYKPNRPRKVTARRVRRERISRAFEKLRCDRERERKLLEIAQRLTDRDDTTELINQALELRRGRNEIVEELVATWPLVPRDAPTTCGCEKTPAFDVPDWLTNQAVLAQP